jgi:signal transduction histidine kinase/DNA-binding response OmpR family regulator
LGWENFMARLIANPFRLEGTDWWRQLRLRVKVRWVILLITSAVLVVACGALFVFDSMRFRQEAQGDLRAAVGIVADNCAAAVAFRNAADAGEVLQSFRAKPHVVAAGVYLTNGTLLAQYPVGPGASVPRSLDSGGEVSDRDLLIVSVPIEFRDTRFGTLRVEYDLEARLQERRPLQMALLVMVLAVSLLLAAVLSQRMQRVVSDPVLRLAATAQRISEHQDYSLRAPPEPGPELASLVDSFNRMLDRIQGQDEALRRANDSLESRVARRTAELSAAVCRLEDEVVRRRQVERELHAAKETAEAGSRAKSEFLANMSHEIRTPMSGVLGMTELLALTSMTAQQQDFVATIRTSGEALLEIINDILDFSKLEAGRLTLHEVAFDVREIAESTAHFVAYGAHAKGLDLCCDLDDDLPESVLGDPGRLREVLTNLLGNAVKFTAQGEVTLEVRTQVLEAGRCILRFVVRDTGIGIAIADQARLFMPFSQVDASTTRAYGGTGLGLAISRRLVSLMGGELELESEPGRGSTFTGEIPFRRPASSPASTVGKARFEQGTHVMIVGRHQRTADILARRLRRRSADVAVVMDTARVLAVVQEEARRDRPYRGVFIDCPHPPDSALDLARSIRRGVGLPLPQVFLLGNLGSQSESHLAQAAELGVFVAKPVRERDIDQAVRCLRAQAQEARTLFREKSVQASVKPAEHRARRVLVAEDNNVNQMLVREQLRRLGHEVVVVEDGAAALLAVQRGEFDVVLMDCQMPNLDGFEATRRIRAWEGSRIGSGRKRVPILAMTASAIAGDKERCLAAGMDGYVPKPTRLQALKEVIDQATLGAKSSSEEGG